MSSSTSDDELQDLSVADAQELRAFLDKRRWFEGKLKLLESLPPIYPFVHPGLQRITPTQGSTSSAPVYADTDGSWRLPSESEIAQWQKERDALEEEILAFDGGDLMRMKHKTRAATLLPLTPPSTHLVSITLALIVLIDRLLTLLRHRGELLELTGVRLQWDQLRWQIMQETMRVRAEIDEIAKVKGRWVPPGQSRKDTRGASGNGYSTPTASPMPRTVTLPSSASVSSLSSDLSSTSLTPSRWTTTLPRSKRDSMSSLASIANGTTPKRSMHLPLLRSSIANLDIRQRNLASTSVSRSGKLLDKMIDIAAPLKSLGGINGPGEGGEGGAVPDELLDIQDELEGEINELETRVGWCKGLERQWEEADKHYLACDGTRRQGQDIFEDLLCAVDQTSSRQRHRDLADRLQKTREILPRPIGPSFPRPSHASYPDHIEHTDRLIDTLTDTRKEAETVIEDCGDSLEWYGKLVDASEKLVQARQHVDATYHNIRGAIDAMKQSEAGALRPRLDDESAIQNSETLTNWLRTVEAKLQSGRDIRDAATKPNRLLAVSIMRFRQIARAAPSALREQLHKGPDMVVADAAENLADNCQEAIDKLSTTIREVEDDAAVMPSVIDAVLETRELDSRIMALQSRLAGLEDGTAEVSTDLRFAVDELEEIFRPDLIRKVDAVDTVLRSQGRRIPGLSDHLASETRRLSDEVQDLRQRFDLASAIHAQNAVIEAIESEGAAYIARIDSLLGQTQQEGAGAETPMMASLRDLRQQLCDEISLWTDTLADRTAFVSTAPLPTADIYLPHQTDPAHRPLLPATTSLAAPPMTPPASPSLAQRFVVPGSHVRADSYELAERDAAARSRINAASSRVRGRMEALNTLMEKGPTDSSDLAERNQQDVFGAIATVPAPVSPVDASLPETIDSLFQRLQALDLAAVLYPSSSVLLQTPSSRQIPSSPKARRIRKDLQAIRLAFDQLVKVSADPSDTHALGSAIEAAEADLPRLDQLVVISRAIKACDEAFSRLLEALDELSDETRDQLQDRRQQGEHAIVTLRKATLDVEDDPRVIAEVKRTETSWQELVALVDDAMNPITPAAQDVDVDAISEVSSVDSMTSQAFAPPAARPSARIASNPLVARAKHLPEQRNRAASDTPSRVRLDSLRSGLPRLRKISMGPPTGISSPSSANAPKARPSTPSSIPRPSRLSNASTQLNTTPNGHASSITPRIRTTSRLSLASSQPSSVPRPRKTYVADPKSKLDVAVGRIVNKLRVDIPIRPVGIDTADEWKDQSGKYWIGAEGRAKLCFCRILRSKTVMVRVGGGWVELGRFLQDHFADSLGTWDPAQAGNNIGPGMGMGIRMGSTTPIPITSATLSTPLRPRSSVSHTPLKTSTTSKAQPPKNHTETVGAEETPRRVPQVGTTPPKNPPYGNLLTPQRTTPQDTPTSLPTPSQAAQRAHLGVSNGSPLVPLHFIRRASESPPVRQMERERLNTGRRSILGRSPSGGVLVVSPEKDTGSPVKR